MRKIRIESRRDAEAAAMFAAPAFAALTYAITAIAVVLAAA